MKIIIIILSIFLIFSCLKSENKENAIENDINVNYVKIFEKSVNIVSNSENEELIIEKEINGEKVRILLEID
jgi:hypothetical protein